MILVSKLMFYKAFSYKTYLLLGLLSPLTNVLFYHIVRQNTKLAHPLKIHALMMKYKGKHTSDRSHTFVEIDQEIISMVILLPSAASFKKGCCQLQAKVCARSTG